MQSGEMRRNGGPQLRLGSQQLVPRLLKVAPKTITWTKSKEDKSKRLIINTSRPGVVIMSMDGSITRTRGVVRLLRGGG